MQLVCTSLYLNIEFFVMKAVGPKRSYLKAILNKKMSKIAEGNSNKNI